MGYWYIDRSIQPVKTEFVVNEYQEPQLVDEKVVLVIGKGRLTPLQERMVEQAMGTRRIRYVYWLGKVEEGDLKKVCREDCPVSYDDSYTYADAVVLEYPIGIVFRELMCRGIPMYVFKTKPVESGGDLADGKVLTVALKHVYYKPFFKTEVSVADVKYEPGENVFEGGTTD